MSLQQDFTADCGACVGLCCTALSFERSSQFGHDKLAGQPCHNLDEQFRCRIHARLEALGYEGCEAFDCLGAGQRASAIFATRNWQRDASVARLLFSRFSLLLRLQEMRQALHTAGDLDLSESVHRTRQALLDRIGKVADSLSEDVDALARAALNDSRTFLKSLAPALSG